MNKERGNLILGKSDHVEKDSFLLTLINRAIASGDVIQNKDFDVVFVSVDASLADKWIMPGIAKMYCYQGYDVMLVINSDQEVDL